MERSKIDLTEAEKLLSHIDSGCERVTWLNVLAGLYTEFNDTARPIAQKWSATSDKFNQKEFNSTWKTLKSGKVNIGTVIKLALNGGYRFPNNLNKKTNDNIISSSFEAVEPCGEDEYEAEGLGEYIASQTPCNSTEKPKVDHEAEEHQKNVKAFRTLWETSKACNNHEYLEKKGIKNHDWRISEKGELLVPVSNNNEELIALQRIFKVEDEGRFAKLFCKGSSYSDGQYSCIGKQEKPKTILVCEGVATAASVHEAIDLMTVIAFSVNNLLKVVHVLKKSYPDADIFVCADDDKDTRGNRNVGVEMARKACRLPNVYHILPKPKANLEGKIDFNDLHVIYDLDYVKLVLMRKIRAVKNGYAVDVIYKKDTVSPESYPFTSKNEKGQVRILSVIANFQFLMDRLGIRFKYNPDKYELKTNVYQEGDSRDDIATMIKSICSVNGLRLTIDDVCKMIEVLANQNSYSPMKNYILSKPWDKEDRLQDIYETIPTQLDSETLKHDELKKLMIRNWLLQIVYSIFSDKPEQLRYVLTLSGEQGCGKSMWFGRLFKGVKDYFSDGFILNASDKDCVMQVLNHGCLELAEIDATFKKTDQAQLKAFITKQYDNVRLPYARESKKYKRKTVFCATVNDHQFLSDATGSSRFWVVSVPKCPHGLATIDFNHDIDMQQVWAQLYEDYYCKGISFRPTDKEAKAIADNNQDNTIVSPMEELLLETFDINSSCRSERMNATKILECCGYKGEFLSKKDTHEMANLLRRYEFEMVRKNQKLYAMPIPKSKNVIGFIKADIPHTQSSKINSQVYGKS